MDDFKQSGVWNQDDQVRETPMNGWFSTGLSISLHATCDLPGVEFLPRKNWKSVSTVSFSVILCLLPERMKNNKYVSGLFTSASFCDRHRWHMWCSWKYPPRICKLSSCISCYVCACLRLSFESQSEPSPSHSLSFFLGEMRSGWVRWCHRVTCR